jgi:hypothetical protein
MRTRLLGKGLQLEPSLSGKPFFCVVLSDGGQWLVEAEWPDGTIMEVDTFKAHLDALTWVRTQSQAWLRERGDAKRDEYRATADECLSLHARWGRKN